MAIIRFPQGGPLAACRLPLTRPRSAYRGAVVGVFLVFPLSTVRLPAFCALTGVVAPGIVTTAPLCCLPSTCVSFPRRLGGLSYVLTAVPVPVYSRGEQH